MKRISKGFYHLNLLDESFIQRIDSLFGVNKGPIIDDPADDLHPNYFSGSSSIKDKENFNKKYTFLTIDEQRQDLVKSIYNKLYSEVRTVLGADWSIINVRSWKTKKNVGNYAANAWHSDQFARGTFKLMIYLEAPNLKNGTTILKYKNKEIPVVGEKGTWLLFDNNNLIHKGEAGTGKLIRTIIELTISVSFKKQEQIVVAGANALYPFYPIGKL